MRAKTLFTALFTALITLFTGCQQPQSHGSHEEISEYCAKRHIEVGSDFAGCLSNAFAAQERSGSRDNFSNFGSFGALNSSPSSAIRMLNVPASSRYEGATTGLEESRQRHHSIYNAARRHGNWELAKEHMGHLKSADKRMMELRD